MGFDQRFEKNKSVYYFAKSFSCRWQKEFLSLFLFLAACSSSAPKNPSITAGPIVVTKKLDMTTLGFQLTETGVNQMPSVSQDERKIIFISSKRPEHQQAQVYLYDLENLTEKRITFQDGDCRDAVFAKGDQKIIYSSNTDELKENPLLFEKSLDGPESKAMAAASAMELYLSDISGAEITRLTTHKGFDGIPWQRPDRAPSFIFSSQEEGKMQAWQFNIEQDAEVMIFKKKDTSLFSLRASPAIRKWAWIERNSEDVSQIFTSVGKTPGIKEQKSALPVGDYRDLSWLNEEQIIFSAKLNLGGKIQQYYQLYTYDIGKNCLEKIFESPSNLTWPQYLKNHQSLIFASDLSSVWQIYNKALPSSSTERQCLAISETKAGL